MHFMLLTFHKFEPWHLRYNLINLKSDLKRLISNISVVTTYYKTCTYI